MTRLQKDKKVNYKTRCEISPCYSILILNMTTTQFDIIKQYILRKGDRQTYCNMYNNNPHLALDEFEVYLNPSIGQANINCDPNLSDFNDLVIRLLHLPVYYDVMLDDNKQTLNFDSPTGKVYFDKLYLFVQRNNQAETGNTSRVYSPE
jgi:hypothetical protein